MLESQSRALNTWIITYFKAAQPMAREVVLSGRDVICSLRRLSKFLVFFVGSSIFAIKTHQNYTCNKCFENMSKF